MALDERIEIASIDDNGSTYLAIEAISGRALLTAGANTGDVVMIGLTTAQIRQAIQVLTLIAERGDSAAAQLTEGARA